MLKVRNAEATAWAVSPWAARAASIRAGGSNDGRGSRPMQAMESVRSMEDWSWSDVPRLVACLRECQPDVVLLLYLGWRLLPRLTVHGQFVSGFTPREPSQAIAG